MTLPSINKVNALRFRAERLKVKKLQELGAPDHYASGVHGPGKQTNQATASQPEFDTHRHHLQDR